jgi:multicomponent K+:H+ antiporter subunit E
MRRWLPSPVLSLALVAMWLLLNRSLSPGHVFLALLVGWLMPWLLRPLRPAAGRMRNPGVLARLVLRVGGHVVLSALQVARGIVVSRRRAPRARFVLVPLELRDPFALAALACITTVVPGTVWCELSRDRSQLLLHVFDEEGDDAFIHRYKSCYEQPLKEIFEP